MGKHVSWEERFEELKDYRKLHGNCNVPQKYQQNKQLGSWVSVQRQQYKKFKNGEKSSMTKERILKLESIEFVWNIGHGAPRQKRKCARSEGLANNHFPPVAQKVSNSKDDDSQCHPRKRQRYESCLSPDVAPSSPTAVIGNAGGKEDTSGSSPSLIDDSAAADNNDIEGGVLNHHYFRDEILAIALKKAYREVWGIIHS